MGVDVLATQLSINFHVLALAYTGNTIVYLKITHKIK